MSEKKCAICDKKCFSFYPLCKEHLEMSRTGEVFKNEKTGKWELKKRKQTKENYNDIIIINEKNKSRCITCGKDSEGLLFCSECYHKYKNKELLFRITKCTNVELLDDDYEGKYTCKDGHIVKSKSEREIDNYLFDNEIKHIYEKELSYGANNKEVIHPDFCLPDYLGKGEHVYIEHWGYNENNINYTKTKKFKMPIYKQLCEENDITLICTYEKSDANKMYDILDRKLNKKHIKLHSINYEE